MKAPSKCKELIEALLENDWSFQVVHRTDTGEHPYVTVEGKQDDRELMITWHTRTTGTYRLFSCMVDRRDVSLKRAMEVVSV